VAVFEYQARRNTGDTISGTMEAVNSEAVAERLLARGMVPINITLQETKSSLFESDVRLLFQKQTVKLQELVIFSRQMYSLSRAGIPLTRAIAGLLETTRSPVLKQALEQILSDLNSGTNLATAFSRHPKIFSDLYVSMIHVGENSGRLEEAFAQIASYLELEQKTRQRIKSAMRYPTFVISAIVAAIFIINIFVIPQFANLFRSFRAGELPLPTQILIATSDFFVQYWFAIVGFLVIALVFFMQWKKTESGRFKWDQIKLRIPIIGSIIYRALLARFARTFSMMSRSGMPLMNALNIVAQVVDNKWVAKHVIEMKEGVERGESISAVAQRTQLFSPLTLQMIAVGEETGQLDDMLEQVAEFYEEEVDYDLKRLSDYIEPVLIVFIGGVVLILALAVYLPMWDLATKVRGN